VGVGGKLDGTNLIEPEVSVITNVGFDHMDVLGNTLELIARDKAGIAKAGVPLVSDAAGDPLQLIRRVCQTVGAPFTEVAAATTLADRRSERYGQSFAVTTAVATYELALPVLGRFQQRNAATAILALERLPERLRPTPGDIERGFAQLVIPGRMEFFPGFPGIVFDVAHNADKAASLAGALRETFPDRRFAIVAAIVETKDAPNILRPLFELPASFIFTSFETPGRTAERPLRLANIAERSGISARVIGDPVEALAIARRQGDGSHVVVVTGSTFVTAVLREWWLDNVVESRR
jgi:dihydrofolate synthase/folylpolyglutamate synthase